MRKLYCLALITIFALVGQTNAQKPKYVYNGNTPDDAIGIISGSTDFFNEEGTIISYSIDFSEANIVEFEKKSHKIERNFGTIDKYNHDHGEEHVQNWPVNLANMTDHACKRLSDQFAATFLPKSEAKGAKYDFVLRMGYYEFGHFVFIGGIKSGGSIIKGIAYLYKAGTDDVLASFDVNYIRGNNASYGNNSRMKQSSGGFARKLKNAK